MIIMLWMAALAIDVGDCQVLSSDRPLEVRPLGDLDLDGAEDFSVFGDNNLEIHLSTAGGPGIVVPHASSAERARAAGGDLDGDGISDLLITTPPPPCVGLGCGRLQSSSVTFHKGPFAAGPLPAPDAWWKAETGLTLISGDHNGDGHPDVGYVEETGSSGGNSYQWRAHPGQDVLALRGEDLSQGGAAIRTWTFYTSAWGFTGFSDYSVHPLGDFDGDGRGDVLYGHINSEQIFLARGREVAVGAPAGGRTRLSDESVSFAVGGFDAQGDGFGDLIAMAGDRVWLTSGGTGWVLGRRYDEAATSTVWRMPSVGHSAAYAGDRFGDGRKWMLVRAGQRAWFVQLPSTPTVRTQAIPAGNLIGQARGTLEWNFDMLGWPADIDGDGDDELLITARIGGVFGSEVACAL
jgi:hypothetical protein